MVKPVCWLALLTAVCGWSGLGCSSTAGTSSDTSSAGAGTAGGSGLSGGSSVAGSTSVAGTSSSVAGATSSGGSSSSAGAAGSSGSAGASSGGSSGSASTGGHVRTGMSAGCGMAPPGADSSKNFVKHEVHITGLDPVYLTGGMYYDTSGGYDLSFRPYGVRLPTNYDPTKPYTVTVGGGGCGGSAANFATSPGGGFQIAPDGTTLQIGLSYINTCFNDGGPAIGNRTDTPEQPYFRAVMADIEAHYCIDLSKVFMAGYSSGGWESYTLACAASDLIRGMGADEGGLRTMHPPCQNATAAVLVAGEIDTENPIGPLDPTIAADKSAIDRLGSFGSAPGRDELLMRNGCNGSTTAPYTPKAGATAYPECVQYTGCPAAYPVIWCALPGVGHNDSTYNNLNYSPGPMWDVLGSLPPP